MATRSHFAAIAEAILVHSRPRDYRERSRRAFNGFTAFGRRPSRKVASCTMAAILCIAFRLTIRWIRAVVVHPVVGKT